VPVRAAEHPGKNVPKSDSIWLANYSEAHIANALELSPESDKKSCPLGHAYLKAVLSTRSGDLEHRITLLRDAQIYLNGYHELHGYTFANTLTFR